GRQQVLEGFLRQVQGDGRVGQAGVGDQANQRALQLADVAGNPLGDVVDDVVGHGELFQLRLLAEDGDPRLQIRRLVGGYQAPLETRPQAFLQRLDLFGGTVAGDDDLPARLVQGVERVEELFLRGLLAGQELDVVDQQHVDAAVPVAELDGAPVADGVDDFVGESFRRNVDHPGVGIALQYAVGDGLHQVGLPQAHPAVQEERVVSAGRRLGHRQGRGVGQPVAAADHEGVEGVAMVERLA